MFSITITNIFQAVALYLLWGEISPYVWWSLLVLFLILFFGVRTHYNTVVEDGENAMTFWYHARSFIFIFNVLSVIALYTYIFFF